MTALEWKDRPDCEGIWIRTTDSAHYDALFVEAKHLSRTEFAGRWARVVPVSAVEAAVAEERRALLAALPGRAHTYASENGDHYMGFDAGIEHVRLMLLARSRPAATTQGETKQ